MNIGIIDGVYTCYSTDTDWPEDTCLCIYYASKRWPEWKESEADKWWPSKVVLVNDIHIPPIWNITGTITVVTRRKLIQFPQSVLLCSSCAFWITVNYTLELVDSQWSGAKVIYFTRTWLDVVPLENITAVHRLQFPCMGSHFSDFNGICSILRARCF